MSQLFGKIDEDISPFNGHRERRLAEMGIQAMSARIHVELPSMPRTRHHIVSQGTLSQRTTCVRADSIQCSKSLFQMKQGDNPAGSNKLATCSDRNL